MPLTGTERVRSLIGDMPKMAISELLNRGPITGNQFQTDTYPIVTGSFQLFVSGTLRASATSSQVQLSQGIIDYTGVATAITANAEVRLNYRWSHLSEDEVQSVIDAVSGNAGDKLLLAAAIAARGLAANEARHFSYRIGEKEVDKSKQSEKWLKLAESLDNAYLNTLKFGNYSMTMATFDNSGTPFDSYDTGVASQYETGTIGGR